MESQYGPKLNINFPNLVNDVADKFLQELKPGVDVEITADAREWLVADAKKKQDEADQLISDGEVTLDFVETQLKQLLFVALGLAKANESDITAEYVKDSATMWCAWLFWC